MQQLRKFKTEKTPNSTQKPRRKQTIPHAIRWQVWLNYAGENFQAKCSTPWCRNIMRAYDFQAGHILAEAAGGAVSLDNLIPICATCNHSMGTMHFSEWAARGAAVPRCCFSLRWLCRLLKAPKPVYPILNPSTTKKIAAPTATQTPLSNIFISPDSFDSSASSDGGTQGDTYHPPPLQSALVSQQQHPQQNA